MKFNHKFSLVNASDRQTVYSDGKKTAQIDFISDSCVRVAAKGSLRTLSSLRFQKYLR